MYRRIFYSLGLLISILFLPFLFSVAFLIFLFYKLENYWQGILICFFSDLFYGVSEPLFLGFKFVFTACAVVVYILTYIIQNKLTEKPHVSI